MKKCCLPKEDCNVFEFSVLYFQTASQDVKMFNIPKNQWSLLPGYPKKITVPTVLPIKIGQATFIGVFGGIIQPQADYTINAKDLCLLSPETDVSWEERGPLLVGGKRPMIVPFIGSMFLGKFHPFI